jgi:hypothetical protein
MAIPVAVGGRPCPRIVPTAVWKRFWRGLLNVLVLHPEPDPLLDPTAIVPDHTAATATDAFTAFSDLFARYHPVLLDYLYGMTRDRELALHRLLLTNLAQTWHTISECTSRN